MPGVMAEVGVEHVGVHVPGGAPGVPGRGEPGRKMGLKEAMAEGEGVWDDARSLIWGLMDPSSSQYLPCKACTMPLFEGASAVRQAWW